MMNLNLIKFAAAAVTGLAITGGFATSAQALIVAGSPGCDFVSGCSVNAINADPDGLLVGDILFSNFTAQGTPVSQFPNIGDLVSLLPDNSSTGQVGLGISASLLANSAFTGVKNLTLKYKATALNGALIDGIAATLDGAAVGGTGQVSLAETAFSDAARTNSLASLLLGAPASSFAPLSGAASFGAPVQMAWLTKDITADAGDAGIAHFSSLINYHTTTAVPTPALLPGLIGFGASLLRKRNKQDEELA